MSKLSKGIWKAIIAVFFVAGAFGQSADAIGTTFTETFEIAGRNVGEWQWGTGSEIFVESNGNPGRYLREDYLVTFTPRASTDFGGESFFTGDYRERNVSSVGVDMAIPYVSGNVTGRTVTLILLNDNGTPDDLGGRLGCIYRN